MAQQIHKLTIFLRFLVLTGFPSLSFFFASFFFFGRPFFLHGTSGVSGRLSVWESKMKCERKADIRIIRIITYSAARLTRFNITQNKSDIFTTMAMATSDLIRIVTHAALDMVCQRSLSMFDSWCRCFPRVELMSLRQCQTMTSPWKKNRYLQKLL